MKSAIGRTRYQWPKVYFFVLPLCFVIYVHIVIFIFVLVIFVVIIVIVLLLFLIDVDVVIIIFCTALLVIGGRTLALVFAWRCRLCGARRASLR